MSQGDLILNKHILSNQNTSVQAPQDRVSGGLLCGLLISHIHYVPTGFQKRSEAPLASRNSQSKGESKLVHSSSKTSPLTGAWSSRCQLRSWPVCNRWGWEILVSLLPYFLPCLSRKYKLCKVPWDWQTPRPSLQRGSGSPCGPERQLGWETSQWLLTFLYLANQRRLKAQQKSGESELYLNEHVD